MHALTAWPSLSGPGTVTLLDALQDSSTSGANVKRLDSESAAAVKNIEKSISSKKKEVSL